MTELLPGPIVIAAGGTGGHFFPAEALAAELQARGRRVVLMTDARTGLRTTGAFAACEQHVLKGAGLAGRNLLRAGKGAALLVAGTIQARGLLARLRPDAVVGFGGYPCVPPILAARGILAAPAGRERPLLVLHEQNAVLGRANRTLARLCDILALGFAETKHIPTGFGAIVTGNPVRPAILGAVRERVIPPGGEIAVLVLGGSLGARVLSAVVPAALARLAPALRSRLRVVQQCRQEDLPGAEAAYRAAGIAARLAPFFTDVAAELATAHLFIGRAGASTVAELAVAGLPAVLVPLPHAIDDHQTANARALAGAGGAWPVAQGAFTPETLAARLAALFDAPEALTAAGHAARTVAQPNAAALLAQAIEDGLAERRWRRQTGPNHREPVRLDSTSRSFAAPPVSSRDLPA
jgi:UDP-N-acetylglucosamine--N-acetylmuramyl-(pentapeptide) pyrophosphoryl-undecaprenol N-acetylglucosamine transferase